VPLDLRRDQACQRRSEGTNCHHPVDDALKSIELFILSYGMSQRHPLEQFKLKTELAMKTGSTCNRHPPSSSLHATKIFDHRPVAAYCSHFARKIVSELR